MSGEGDLDPQGLSALAVQVLEEQARKDIQKVIKPTLVGIKGAKECEDFIFAWASGQHPMATVYQTGPNVLESARRIVATLGRHLVETVESRSSQKFKGAAGVSAILAVGDIVKTVIEPVAATTGTSSAVLTPIAVYVIYLAGCTSWKVFKEWVAQQELALAPNQQEKKQIPEAGSPDKKHSSQ